MRAMILAAGLGTRMRPLTLNCPKPMLPVLGRPLIEHHIIRLKKAGITEITINHAYLGEQIEAHLKKGQSLGVNIHYSAEPSDTPLETGGGICKALPLVSPDGKPFLVINGDIWLDYPLKTLIDSDIDSQELATLVLVDNPKHNPEGDFYLDPRGKVFAKAPQAQKKLTFSGVSLLSPKLFEGVPKGAFKLAPLLKQAMKTQQVSGVYHSDYWLDVGTPQRLIQLEQHLSQSYRYE